MSLCIPQPDPGEVLNYNKNSTSVHNRREVKKKKETPVYIPVIIEKGKKAKPHDLGLK